MNNKGIWRIIEAVLAVLLLAGALLVFSAREQEKSGNDELFMKIRASLDEAAKNDLVRESIVTGSGTENVANIIRDNLDDPRFEVSVIICNFTPGVPCGNPPPEAIGEVFSEERLISGTLSSSNAKVVKIYVYEK